MIWVLDTAMHMPDGVQYIVPIPSTVTGIVLACQAFPPSAEKYRYVWPLPRPGNPRNEAEQEDTEEHDTLAHPIMPGPPLPPVELPPAGSKPA
jgi:hypothetical protein